MKNCERFMPSQDCVIFVVKPDGLSRTVGSCPLITLIREFFDLAHLRIAFETEKRLTEEGVRKLYKILNQPSEYGERWKTDVISHMCSGPVFWFLLYGDNAQDKAKLIKDFLRAGFTDRKTERGKIIENIAHVVDLNDFKDSIDVLY